MEAQLEPQSPERITETELRSRAFIKVLNQKNFPIHDFQYRELGPVDKNNLLEKVEITATREGWLMYSRFVYTLSNGTWNID